MISIIKAGSNDYETIVELGRVSVEEAHRESCAATDLSEYIERNYSHEAIRNELIDANNTYHIL